MTAEASDSGLDDFIPGMFRALVARAFVELVLPDTLGDQLMTLAELSVVTRAEPDTLARLLRAAEAAGMCSSSNGSYGLTAVGQALRSDAPGNSAGWLLLMTSPWTVRAWERLSDAVRSARPSFLEVHGQGFWEYVARHPSEAGAFDAVMTSGAIARADDLRRAVDWSSVSLVVDVGGGQGLLVATLLADVSHLRGLVADRAEVIASPTAASLELGGRLDLTATDFFEAVPGGGDLYVLSRILHDWPDSEAIAILRRCRAAMGSEARLCVLEQIAPESGSLSLPEQFGLAVKDLNMLVLVGGQERTLSEYRDLLAAAHFEIDDVTHGAACDVIHARPVHGR